MPPVAITEAEPSLPEHPGIVAIVLPSTLDGCDNETSIEPGQPFASIIE
ncbi:MAG: hypothetical protein IPN88_13640 [Bacteroidetes bacterium]|nr:hypothetical protein [Bacteroidota bacterium]